MTRFEDDHERAAFVRWVEQAECRVPRVVAQKAQEITEDLLARGWTRHGYWEDWVPPGMIYVAHQGIFEPDDPNAIAGLWRCRCGFETDRLVHAQGHMYRAERGESLHGKPPHEMAEVENRGPEHKEWGSE